FDAPHVAFLSIFGQKFFHSLIRFRRSSSSLARTLSMTSSKLWSVSDEYSLLVDIDLDAAASLQPNSFSEMFQRTGPDKGIRIGHQTFSMLRQNAPLDSLSMPARFVTNSVFFHGNIYIFLAIHSL